MQEMDFLTQVPLFASLGPAHFQELANRLKNQVFHRGETVFHKDDPGSWFYIIKTGQVKITTPSPEGAEVILAILTDNDFFGELSLLDGKPRSASATAMLPTQTLTLYRQDLLEVLTRHPDLAITILDVVSKRLRRTNCLVEDAVFLDLPSRLAKRLLELADKHGIVTTDGLEIRLHLTQQDLADAVGASRVSVNRQLGLFQTRGLIHMERQRIIIPNLEGLRHLLE